MRGEGVALGQVAHAAGSKGSTLQLSGTFLLLFTRGGPIKTHTRESEEGRGRKKEGEREKEGDRVS